jgi:alpha-tubulin suppressor-like RCC1 family protein
MTTGKSTAVAVSGMSSGLTAIAAGNGHTCALTSGGSLHCWGNHSDGQLGDGTTIAKSRAVAVSGMSSGVTAIGILRNSSC